MKKLLLGLTVVLMNFQIVYAQSGSIAGTITDNSGEALVGATIVIKGTTKGTTTSLDGGFKLQSSNGNVVIVISYIGYKDKTMTVSVEDGKTTQLGKVKITESTSTLDAVTITSGRRPEKVREASANIQLVDAKTIQVSQAPTAYGLLKNVTGLDFVETGMGQQQVNARGFASIFTGGVLTLVDYRNVTLPGIGGVFGPTMAVNQNDIKQIEVIVGPNSALYGANAANGVINIITKNPKEYAGHSVQIKGGTRNQIGADFRSSMMIGDKFGYKVSGEYFTAEDFDQSVKLTGVNVAGNDLSNVETNPDNTIKNIAVTGSLYYFPSENTELSYTYGRAIANYVNQSNIGPLQVKDFTFWYHQFRANFSNLLGGSGFLQVNYTEDDAKDTYNLEGAAARVTLFGMTEAEAAEATKFFDKPTRITAEFQHNFNLADDNIVTWGAQFTDTKPNSGGTFLSDGPNGEQIQIKEFGAYVQYENEMIKDINLTVSGRYDNNDNFGSQFSPKFSISYKPGSHNFRFAWNQAFSSPPLQPAFALSPITSLVAPDLDVAPPNGVFVPAIANPLVLRGAKDKGFNILDASGSVVNTIKALSPTVTKSWEIGYKGLLSDKFFVDITYFSTITTNFLSAPIAINNPELIYDGTSVGAGDIHTGIGWNNLLIANATGQAPVPTDLTYVEGYGNELVLSYINYGQVKSKGINITMDYQINDEFSANASFQSISFDKFTDVPATVTSTPNTNAPTNTARAGFKYAKKDGIYIDLSGRWVEEYSVSAARAYSTGDIPTYWVVDLKAEMPIAAAEGLNVGLNINNIFNKKYRAIPGTPELGFLGTLYVRFDF